MKLELSRLTTRRRPAGPVLLIVADGVGIAEPSEANSVWLAHTPVMDELLKSKWRVDLCAHGTSVGLPTDDDMGNSEVGHNTLGGGRVFAQGAKLVKEAFETGSIFQNENWQSVESAAADGGTVHFLGLLSDGNVHANIDHLFALMDRCDQQGVRSVAVHALLDGRDVAPQSALTYLEQLNSRCEQINQKSDRHYRLASAGGRMMITMDRYQADWPMVKRGWDCHVLGIGNPVVDASAEVQRQYDANNGITDQMLEPFVMVDGDHQPLGKVENGDAVVLFNFRGDRAMEICQAFEQESFEHFDRGVRPDVFFCGMLQYDGDLFIPTRYLVDPPNIERPMVEYLSAAGIKSFAISETQKFGHVTYFWNGNRSGFFDEALETHIEVPSDNIPFDQAPEMKASQIAEETIRLLKTGEYRFGRINFANGDMVGHTGNIEATSKSIEAVDTCVGKLIKTMRELRGTLIFTSDHGNADEMFVEKNGERVLKTSHTLNPVPFVIVDTSQEPTYEFTEGIESPGLANVASTVFNLMGFRAPDEYLPSLIQFPNEPSSVDSIYRGRIVNVLQETITLPNDQQLELDIVRHSGGVVIVLVDNDGQICLLRQYRHAAGGYIWEFPAGRLEGNEAPAEAARRELVEETGCAANDISAMGSMLTTPGFCDEELHLFLATDITKGQASPELHEVIEVHWFTPETIDQMILQGKITDGKTITAWFHARSKQ
ncbi:MAG: 2,3-bisphosphoglycerate-independent phosphoglycerate mutase [Pseudomonadota bacterium]